MELTKEFTVFTRKADEFLFTLEKAIDEECCEVFYLELCVPGYETLEEEVTDCPEAAMKKLMAAHLARTRQVKLTPRKKLLIVT